MELHILGFIGILVANLVAALDAAALSVSLPTIAYDLKTTSIEAYWAGTSFVLSSAACQPLFPAFSNTFGRRPVVAFALVVLIVGTIVCGTAQNVSGLLAGRTIQGVGGGGILAMTYTVMTDLFDLRQRSTAISINGLVWLLGAAIGPVMGGAFSSLVSWRWIFWICLPILGIALFLVLLFMKPPKTDPSLAKPLTDPRNLPHTWRNFDWIGAVLLVSPLTALLVSISWGGIMFSWNSWHTLVPLILGVVGLAGWLVYETTIPVNPMIPVTIFRNWTTSSSLFGTLILGAIQFGLVFYLPLYCQIIKGYSAIVSGVAILPITLVSGLTTAFTGILISKIGQYKIAVLIGWAMLALGSGLLELLGAHSEVAQWIFISAVSGLGGGILFTALVIAAQAHVPKDQIALASALTPFIRAIGQAIGITAGNSIIQNGLKHQLQTAANPLLRQQATYIANNLASPAILSDIPQDYSQRQQLLAAYNTALHHFWWFLCAAALFAGLLSLLIKDVSLDAHNKTSEEVESLGADTLATYDFSRKGSAANDLEGNVDLRISPEEVNITVPSEKGS